jgi:hypothetical protein
MATSEQNQELAHALAKVQGLHGKRVTRSKERICILLLWGTEEKALLSPCTAKTRWDMEYAERFHVETIDR